MAKRYNNDKRLLILEMTPTDCVNANFDTICMTCNQFSFEKENDNRYYVGALNDLMCKDCLDKWLKNPLTKRYEEDIPYETLHYDYYAKMLGVKTIQDET